MQTRPVFAEMVTYDVYSSNYMDDDNMMDDISEEDEENPVVKYPLAHTDVHARLHTHIDACTHTHIYMHSCTYAYAHVHTHVHTCANTYTYIHIYVCKLFTARRITTALRSINDNHADVIGSLTVGLYVAMHIAIPSHSINDIITSRHCHLL